MFNFKKRFGQNFLTNQSIIEKITSCFNKYDEIIEIGPGDGALTKSLIKKGKKITAIDIDIEAINSLQALNLEINLIHADILKYPLPSNMPVVGNLPYNISAKIVEKIVKNTVPFAVFMFQKEVAEILTGVNKSRLTIFAQSSYKITKLIDVKPENFIPRPKVNSQIVIFERIQTWPQEYLKTLANLAAVIFNCKRKMLRSLNKKYPKLINHLENLNINLEIRAENLDKQIFYELAKIDDLL